MIRRLSPLSPYVMPSIVFIVFPFKKPTCHKQKVLSTIIIATLAYNINVFRCLYPNLCTARQWLVRAVDNLAASRYKNLVSVLIGTVRLYCDDGVSFSCLAVAFNDMLVNVYYCLHLKTLTFSWLTFSS